MKFVGVVLRRRRPCGIKKWCVTSHGRATRLRGATKVDFHAGRRCRGRNRGACLAYEGAASDSFDDLAHLGVAEAKQDESSALVPE